MKLIRWFFLSLVEASCIVMVWTFTRPIGIRISMDPSWNQFMSVKLGELGSFLGLHIDYWLPVLAISLTALFFRLYERSLYLRKIPIKSGKERQPQQNQKNPDVQQNQIDITGLLRGGGNAII